MRRLNMIIVKLTLFCIPIVFSNCTSKSINDPGVPMQELKDKILSDYDINAYEKLYIGYFDYFPQEVLIYSAVIAHKCKNANADFNMYFDIVSAHPNGLVDMDNDLREIAIQYLKKSVALNHPSACGVLGELYIEGKYLPKDTILGKKLRSFGEKRWKKKPWYNNIFN